MKTAKSSKAIDEVAERVLTYMTLSDFRKTPEGPDISLRTFSGALPLLDEWTDRMEGVEVFAHALPTDLARPLNIAMLSATDNTDFPDDASLFTLIRTRAMKLSEVRGQLRVPRRYVVRLDSAWIQEAGVATGATSLMGSSDGRTWEQVSNRYNPDNAYGGEWGRAVAVSHGMQFTGESYWHVSLGWIGQPSVTFWTDPVGARAIFRLRDIPEGRTRRAALRHWVTEHWRQDRRDHNEEVFVREHLRGAERFVWNDFVCELRASTDDVRKADRATHERQQMRAEGADRRSVSS